MIKILKYYFKQPVYAHSWLYLTAFIAGIVYFKQASHLYSFFSCISVALLTSAIWLYICQKLLFKHVQIIFLLYAAFMCGLGYIALQDIKQSRFLREATRPQDYLVEIVSIDNQKEQIVAYLKSQHAHVLLKPKNIAAIQVGDIIFFSKVSFAKTASNSYAWFLNKNGLLGSARTDEYTLIHRPNIHVGRWIHMQKNRIQCFCKERMSPILSTMFLSVFMGITDNSAQTISIKKTFNKWGLGHLLARSGLHVGIIVFCLLALLRLVTLHLFIKKIIIAIFIIFYYLITTTSVSFLRAMVTYFTSLLYLLGSIAIHPLHVFMLSMLMVILYNPYSLFFLDFQLSFGATFCILYFSQFISEKPTL